jgi:uncharacterized protein (TIGR02597 family)
MKIMKATAMVAVALAALAGPSIGEQPTILGYNKITVPKDADVIVSVPFVNKAEATYTVNGTGANSVTVTGLAADSYEAGKYYVRFTTGDAKGLWSTIAANTSGALTLEDTSFFAKIAIGNEFKVYKHKTLSEVFPDRLETLSFVASVKHPTFPIIETYRTQVLVFQGAPTGINKAPQTTYFFYNDAWRKFGDLNTNYDDAILLPDSYFILRNQNNDGELTFLPEGKVPTAPAAKELVSGVENDVLVAAGPVPVKLAELGLGGTPAFEDSVKHPTFPIIETYGDLLLVFSKSGSILNRAPTATYFYYNGAWRKFGDLNTNYDDAVIGASEGFIVRKSSQGSGSYVWTVSE